MKLIIQKGGNYIMNELSALKDFLQFSQNMIAQESLKEDGTGCKYRPVFVVLIYSGTGFSQLADHFVKGAQYWHAGLAFGPSLGNIYSFNFGKYGTNKFKGGLSFESIDAYKEKHPEGYCYVGCVLLTPDRYKKLKANLNYYMENKSKTRYSFINLIWSLFGRKKKMGEFSFVCSTFVDAVLKSVNVDLNGKANNLVKPDDLLSKNPNEIEIYKGDIVKYDAENARQKVEKYANNKNYAYFSRGGYSRYRGTA